VHYGPIPQLGAPEQQKNTADKQINTTESRTKTGNQPIASVQLIYLFMYLGFQVLFFCAIKSNLVKYQSQWHYLHAHIFVRAAFCGGGVSGRAEFFPDPYLFRKECQVTSQDN
jgi:fucose permease